MDAKHTLESTVASEMFKGSDKPEGFPHRCPLNPLGLDRQQCIAMSGSNVERNRETCFGPNRNGYTFPACNSEARRCVVCLEIGRRGAQAKAVTNLEKGTCDEHISAAQVEPKPPAGYAIRPAKPVAPFSERHRDRIIAAPAVQTPSPVAVRFAPQKRAAPIPPKPPEPKPPAARQEVRPSGAFKDVSEAERIVLHGIAYGYDFDAIEARLREKQVTENIAPILRKLYRDFNIPSDLTEWSARRTLGKLFLDSGEAARSQEQAVETVVEAEPIMHRETDASTEDELAARASKLNQEPVIEAALAKVNDLAIYHQKVIFHFGKASSIASLMGLKTSSVENYIHEIYEKLGLTSYDIGFKRKILAEIRSRYRAASGGIEPEIKIDEAVISNALANVVHLTPRQRELFLLMDRTSNLEITSQMGISEVSLPTYMTNLYRRLGMQSLKDQEKRPALRRVLARHLESKQGGEKEAAFTSRDAAAKVESITAEESAHPPVANPPAEQFKIERERLEYLESALNTILDLAEAMLKRIGGKRRGS